MLPSVKLLFLLILNSEGKRKIFVHFLHSIGMVYIFLQMEKM